MIKLIILSQVNLGDRSAVPGETVEVEQSFARDLINTRRARYLTQAEVQEGLKPAGPETLEGGETVQINDPAPVIGDPTASEADPVAEVTDPALTESDPSPAPNKRGKK